ncbi:MULTISPECIES: ammonium transporter [Corynebacterium]|uniref:ammonium transporter n=1 Tax=Corynebacterium TaxID=1716 RepID=UPI00124DA674|nr:MULTISPECIES: ammonium transporter [Corynebacterium]
MEGNASWMLMSASLVLLMTPALSMFYGGMSRQKSVLNTMMMSFGAMGVVIPIFILYGWSMSYGGKDLAGIVADPFTDFGLRNVMTDGAGDYVMSEAGYPAIIDVAFQVTFAVISVALISGAIAERVKFSSWLVFAGLWVTFAYFPLAHMVWGGGLLSESSHSIAGWLFGSEGEDALIGPVDFAGGTVVHIAAGTAALVLAVVSGRRRGFPRHVHRPHNLPMVMIGSGLLWFGWCGFNAGSAFAADGLAGLAWMNTAAAAAAGIIGWLVVERFRDHHMTSLGAASGVVAGLVAITPAAGALDPVGSLVLGAVGGGLAAWAVSWKYRFGLDDTLDVVGVHLVAGLWGTIGLALLDTNIGIFYGGGSDGFALLVVQFAVALAAMVVSAAVTVVMALIIRSTMGWRIEETDEESGIDYRIHGETAYETSSMRF